MAHTFFFYSDSLHFFVPPVLLEFRVSVVFLLHYPTQDAFGACSHVLLMANDHHEIRRGSVDATQNLCDTEIIDGSIHQPTNQPSYLRWSSTSYILTAVWLSTLHRTRPWQKLKPYEHQVLIHLLPQSQVPLNFALGPCWTMGDGTFPSIFSFYFDSNVKKSMLLYHIRWPEIMDEKITTIVIWKGK